MNKKKIWKYIKEFFEGFNHMLTGMCFPRSKNWRYYDYYLKHNLERDIPKLEKKLKEKKDLYETVKDAKNPND